MPRLHSYGQALPMLVVYVGNDDDITPIATEKAGHLDNRYARCAVRAKQGGKE
jgi:hypothetical protein